MSKRYFVDAGRIRAGQIFSFFSKFVTQRNTQTQLLIASLLSLITTKTASRARQ
jgi:hypothetical protein